MGLLGELRPLFKKSWLLLLRNRISRFFRFIFFPGLLILASVLLINSMFRTGKANLRVNPSYNNLDSIVIDSYNACSERAGVACAIGVAPSLSIVTGGLTISQQQLLFEKWISLLELELRPFPLITFANNSDFELSYAKNDKLYAGIIADFSKYHSGVKYDVRLPYSLLASPAPYQAPTLALPEISDLIGGSYNFVSSGFNKLQMAADTSLANLLHAVPPSSWPTPTSSHQTMPSTLAENSTITLQAQVSRGPYTEFTVAANALWIPITLFLTYFPIAGYFVHEAVVDKDSKTKAYLHAMGMTGRAYWISHVLLAVISVVPVVSAQIGFTIWGGLWGQNVLYGVFFLLGFAGCVVAIIAMNSVLAQSARAAQLWNVLFFILPLILGKFILGAPFGVRLAFSLLAPFNLLFAGMDAVKETTLTITGATNRVPPALQAIPNMPPSVSLFMFAFDIFLYTLIAIFVSWWRIPKQPKPSGKKPIKRKSGRNPPDTVVQSDENRLLALMGNSSMDSLANVLSEAEDAIEITEGINFRASRNYEFFEPRDDRDSELIRILTQNLSLHPSGKQEPELAPLDLRIDEGVYVLVGGHSCGKSALLSILSGFTVPTQGSVEIDGYSLYDQRDHALSHISVCPATDHFDEQLTGHEHLSFILSFRDDEMSKDQAKERVDEMLEMIGLSFAANEPISKYSAGMRRCLMAAAALISPARVVFMDEASTGMNLEQKQAIWSTIMHKRQSGDGTTFIIATNCLDEAETIADRIGIMFNGALLREGSLEFLTRRMKYQISKKAKNPADEEDQYPVRATKESLPQQIREMESNGNVPISVAAPSLRRILAEMEQELDESTDIDAVLDNTKTTKSNDSFPKGPLFRETPPKRANTFQQTMQYLKRSIPVSLRRRGTLLAFLLVPLIMAAIGLGSSRIPAHSLAGMPKILRVLRPNSTDPVTLGISHKLPTIIPSFPTSPEAMSMFSPWEINGQLSFPIFESPKALYNYLWSAKHPFQLRVGGLEFNDIGPNVYSYNVVYNQSEVYSIVDLINLVNNMAVRDFLKQSSDILLPANATDPFIQLRSVPLAPREIATLKQDSDTEKMHDVVIAIAGAESSFPHQICISLAIVGALLGAQLINERMNGLAAQLRRSGLRLVSYWLGSLIWAWMRLLIISCILLCLVAAFQVSFLKGLPFLLFTLSLFILALTVPPLVVVLSRNQTSVETVVRMLVMLVIIPKIIEGILPSVIGTRASLQILVKIVTRVHYLSPMALFPSFVSQMALTYAHEGFQVASLHSILSLSRGGPEFFLQIAHLLLWGFLFWLLEFRSRIVEQGTKDELEEGGVLEDHFSATKRSFKMDENSKHLNFLETGVVDLGRGFGAEVPLVPLSAGLQQLNPESTIYHTPPGSPAVSKPVPTRRKSGVVSSSMEEASSQGDIETVISLDSETPEINGSTSAHHQGSAILTQNLVKRFDDMPRRAINSLNLSIPIGHNYALLGPMLSGKTTILSVLLGDEPSTSGNLEIYGNCVIGMNKNHLYNVARFGACLQRDSLFPELTVKEHIELYLSLRNDLYDIDVPSATRFILQKAKLVRFADTRTDKLDKGPKQKLNLALAVLTFTETLILDEPTRGCDFASRKTIWELLRYVHTDENKSLMISTTSIEEAMAVCSTVGILVNGEIIACGSPDELNDVCTGYELKIWAHDHSEKPWKTREAELKKGELKEANEIESHISRNLSICTTYDLPQSIDLASTIEQLNHAARDGQIIDYSITSINPELAYLRASRYQADDYSKFSVSESRTCNCLSKLVSKLKK